MAYRNPHQPPSWSLNGSSYPALPNLPSKWEQFLLAENIAEQDFGTNPKVLDFVIKNSRHYFVPTKVLRLYGLDYEDAT